MSDGRSPKRTPRQVARSIVLPKPPSSKVRPSLAEADGRALVDELGRLKGRFDGTGHAAREKLRLLFRLRDVPLPRRGLLRSYHDLLLFLRAYPDNEEVLEEAERQLAAFRARIETYRAAARDADASALVKA